MNRRTICALAIGLASLAGAATAGPSDVDRFFADARAQAEARLAGQHVDLGGREVAVSGYVGGDGRVNSVRVVRSSGSLELDRAVEKALHLLRASEAPAPLVGARVTLRLGGKALSGAAAK